MAPPEAAQESAQGGRRFDYAAESAGRPAGAQRIGVVDAVAARQRGGHQGHHLVPRVGPPRRAAQVETLLDEFGQAQVLGEGGRKRETGIGHQLELEADHRRHAEIENAIRDLKYGVGLNHLPSGRFAANAAWLAGQVMAHNLARWTARIGRGEQIVTTKTLRRRFFALAGRLTRSARRITLHLPKRWPWQEQFSRALARLRAIPLPA